MYAPGDREYLIDVLVEQVMGIPPADPRAAQLRTILSEHWDAAVAAQLEGTQDAKAITALRSTFMVACGSAPALSTSL